MDKVAEIIKLIQSCPGYNDKQYLLKKNENAEGLKEILRFIYDPYNKTGISSAKLSKALQLQVEFVVIPYYTMIKYLKMNKTGSDADLAIVARFIKYVSTMYPSAVDLAKAIVTQDLQIGVTAKTLNQVYGDNFIPTVGCMLGTGIEKVKKIAWPCIVTEKLDGVRRILIKEDGICSFYSRSGHVDTGLNEILADASYLPDNRMYDGELLATGTYVDAVALRQATNSRAAIKGEKTGLTFNIFDMVPLEEFYAGRSDDNAMNRKIMLGATLMDESIEILRPEDYHLLIASYGIHRTLDHIKSVPILGLVKNFDEITPIVAPIWAAKMEGVMLNASNSYYEVKRSTQLLKVKRTEEHTLVVVDMQEGMGRNEGVLGALIVDYKGFRLGVGSGFTDAQRYEIWEDYDRYIGRSIEVDCFGESTNAQNGKSLNCPVFKRFVGSDI